MKIYVSVDMEGMPGTFSWTQEEGAERAAVRKAMTEHMESIIEGIRTSERNEEVTEIIVADSHAMGDNLSYDLTERDDRLHLVSGSPRPFYMMPAFPPDATMVFFVGYHGGKGRMFAAMDHTYSSRSIQAIRVNGVTMNEGMLNGAFAGSFGVPVSLVTGDRALADELREKEAFVGARMVVTKEAVSRAASKLRPKELVRRETLEAVRAVLARDHVMAAPYVVEGPVLIEFDLVHSAMADQACLIPNMQRMSATTIRYEHPDYGPILDLVMAVTYLSATVR